MKIITVTVLPPSLNFSKEATVSQNIIFSVTAEYKYGFDLEIGHLNSRAVDSLAV